MRMRQSEAKVPLRDVGASNKHGPPVWPPPDVGLRIRGKPRTREPVAGRVPARNKAPASQLKLVLMIKAPSLLWESYVRPPTERQPSHRIETGNNYWETGTAPGISPPSHPSRHQASGCRTGEVWGEGKEGECVRVINTMGRRRGESQPSYFWGFNRQKGRRDPLAFEGFDDQRTMYKKRISS